MQQIDFVQGRRFTPQTRLDSLPSPLYGTILSWRFAGIMGDRYGRRDSLRVNAKIRGGPPRWGRFTASPNALPHAATTLGFVTVLFDAQLLLDLFQRYVFCLRNHGLHPYELQHHHAGEKRKDIPGREAGNHSREKRRE